MGLHVKLTLIGAMVKSVTIESVEDATRVTFKCLTQVEKRTRRNVIYIYFLINYI